jgi:hypothetical protein
LEETMKRVFTLAFVLLCLTAIVAACGSGITTATVVTTSPTTVGAVDMTTATTPEATSTTTGPETTATTIAETTTTRPKELTAAAIVAGLKAAELPVSDVVEYTAENDPNELLGRPGQYVQKVNFSDSKLEEPSDGDGTVEVFQNQGDAKQRKEYVDSISKDMPTLGYYTYQSGPYVLRIAFAVPPARADAYEAAFLDMIGKN